MNIKIHWIGSRHVELSVDDVQSGMLNKDEALELAKDLIAAASELLECKS